MYRIELLENQKVLKFKEFDKLDDIFKYSNTLLKELSLGKLIIIYEKKDGFSIYSGHLFS
ncbi:hypothetical protein [Cetobacterium somerae]